MAFEAQNLLTAISSLSTGSSSNPVKIGSVTLTGSEVPDLISVGGNQVLIIDKMPGGARVIQALGDDPARIALQGKFLGSTALKRAAQVQALRTAGSPVTVSFVNLQMLGVIASFSYDVTEKGFVVFYRLEIEIQPQAATATVNTQSQLAAFLGNDLSSTLTSATTEISKLATYGQDIISQADTVLGQVTPVANLIGAGSLMATVQDKLTLASSYTSSLTSLSSLPSAVTSAVASMQSAGTSLSQVISASGANISGIQLGSAASVAAVTVNSGIQAAAVQSAGYLNRAYKTAQQILGNDSSTVLVSAT